MASGALSSLGIGSSVLTYDIIEKLREADEKGRISPIDRKLEEVKAKQTDLGSIVGHLNMLKTTAAGLSSDLLFQGRSVNSSGDTGVSIKADPGVKTQNITVEVYKIAARDIYQSKAYASDTSLLGVDEGTLTMNIDGKDYDIAISAGMTMEDFAKEVARKTEGAIEVKTLNVGGDDPYRMIIQSKETGANQAITFLGDTEIITGLGLDDSDNKLDTAVNASFKYNGIPMQRTTNEITDITVGLTINLLQATDKPANFSVVQDTQALADEMQSFVNAYNELVTNLNASTDYNQENNTMGTLQGVSQVNSIKSQLNRLLISMDSEGRSLTEYGLRVGEDGLFSFNAVKLIEKLNENPDDVESFFKGLSTADELSYYSKDPIQAGAIDLQYGDFKLNGFSFVFATPAGNSAEENLTAFKDKINQYTSEHGVIASLDANGTRLILKSSSGTDIKIEGNASKLAQLGVESIDLKSKITSNVGVFSSLSEILDNMLKESNGSITLLDNQYTNEQKRLTEERKRTMEQLDSKYAAMVSQFAAYDTIIANLNNQFSSLQSMIDAQLNSK